jgi:hypothetical protein
LYLILLFIFFTPDFYYYYVALVWLLLLVGLFLLLTILTESFYIKAFLAMSSILNTLIVFIALSSTNIIDLTLVC